MSIKVYSSKDPYNSYFLLPSSANIFVGKFSPVNNTCVHEKAPSIFQMMSFSGVLMFSGYVISLFR